MAVKLRVILDAVCDEFDVEPDEVLNTRLKFKSISQARAVAIALGRELTGKSWAELARFFGNCDHSSVIQAVRRVDRDRDLFETRDRIKDRLLND